MAAPDPILATKLHMPPPRPNLVSRPRLLEKLNKGLTRQLTLISAPAGFGKTTLLGEWRRTPPGSEWPLAWISLDEGDNDPARFWTYVIVALETLQPGIGENALPLLRAGHPHPSNIESILMLLINDLITIPDNFVLVLDDYHVIETEPIHRALTFLLDHLPSHAGSDGGYQGMHLVILSRADPPLPLARLRARRQLTELRDADLRFTLDEATELLNRVMGLKLSAGEIEALETRTEGWVTGLQLAAISLQGHTDVSGFIKDFTGSHHYVLDYLTEEVLQRQPESLQTFLLQTAILDRLTGPLCDAVTGRDDGQTILKELERTNLFLIPLDEQRRWYRYHRLFGELLRHRLQLLQTDQLPELHRRAAVWYDNQGFIREAINHALAAQDVDYATGLIEHSARTMFLRGEMSDLLRWLETIPQEQVFARPQLCLVSAWLQFFTGNLDAAEQRLQDVKRLLKVDESDQTQISEAGRSLEIQVVLNQVIALDGQIALIRGDIPRAIELSRQALDHLPEGELALRGLTAVNLGTAYWLNGDVEAADQILAEVRTTGQAGDGVATLVNTSNLAELRRIQGHLSQAALLYRRTLQLATKRGGPPLSLFVGLAYVGLGNLLYEWNNLDAAARHLWQGIELGQEGAGGRVLVTGYVGLARVFQAQGEFDQALEMMQQAEQLVQGLDLGLVVNWVGAVQARLWLAQSNLEAAAQWAQGYGLSVSDELDVPHEFEYIILARVLVARHELDVVLELLARLLPKAEGAGRTRSAIETLLLQALAYQAQGHISPALTALERALSLAEPEGYVRIFADEGAPMAALLLQFSEKRQKATPDSLPTRLYLNKLLVALGVDSVIPAAASLPETVQSLVEPLTERELEVLHLIAAGLSNQEIAEELSVAKTTLKTHVRNIYGKLDAHSRIQAVAKAKALGLL